MKCAALYNHTNIRGGNRIYPCCRYKENIMWFDGDVGKILDSYMYRKLRADMELDWLPGCGKCKHEEELGVESLRQKFNKHYTMSDPKLRYLEVGFDNICDLTCDGCWEEWSSAWWAKKNPNLPPKQGITSTEEFINIPDTVDRVVFLGGEPLMTSRHRKFLESLNSLESIKVEYFTNGMHKLTEDDYQILNKCKHVHFTISIDGYHVLNETVRSGSIWSRVQKTVDEIADTFDYTIHTTIHKNNWQGLPELAVWAKNYKKWTTNVLTYPQELDIINLEQCDKKQLIEWLSIYDIPNRQYIKAHLEGDA